MTFLTQAELDHRLNILEGRYRRQARPLTADDVQQMAAAIGRAVATVNKQAEPYARILAEAVRRFDASPLAQAARSLSEMKIERNSPLGRFIRTLDAQC